jgi:mannosyltransferase OCH1-like enzyme
MIPKVIIQTSRNGIPEYVKNMIMEKANAWTYRHFNDEEVLAFFSENPLPEFPDVIQKFCTYSYGEHRADLFRYYYLYVNGGVYIDSDAMIEDDMENIVQDYDFFSVNSTYLPYSIFQGFIGCTAKNTIMYEALKDLYNKTNDELIADFHILCKNMYKFTFAHLNDYNVKLYLEQSCKNNCYNIVDPENIKNLVLVHYSETKIIPPRT